ncbi:MAG: uridine kinase [Bacteroidia bacterium]
MHKPYVLGICGGSASGKTFLLRQLLSRMPEDAVTLVSQDNYYKKLEDQHRDDEGLVNFDHPDSLDLDRFTEHIRRLIRGETVEIEEYTFNNPKVTPRVLTLSPTPLIILEGLFVFYKPELAQLIDLKVFVEADEHVRLSRRLRRDYTERGYSFESILRDYEKFVAPMYQQYVLPTRRVCDFVVPNNRHMYKAVQVIANHLQAILSEPAGE